MIKRKKMSDLLTHRFGTHMETKMKFFSQCNSLPFLALPGFDFISTFVFDAFFLGLFAS